MRRRRLLIVFFLAIALLGGAIASLRFYLRSGHATATIAARLRDALGVQVQVAGSEIGLSGGSRLDDVQVFEKNKVPKADDQPWLRVDRVDTDASALSLLTGPSSLQITLQGIAVTLRFDKDGHFTTQLPSIPTGSGTLPEIILTDGKLTLSQDGREPMILKGIEGKLTPKGNDLAIEGKIVDSYWGNWDVGGTVATGDELVTLTFQTPRADVTAARLKGLPFVPPEVWREVMVEGTAPIRLTVTFPFGKDGDVHYRVEAQPANARVNVSAIGLVADEASGTVVVEDELVTLSGVKGRTAGGAIETDGKLDFRPTPSVLDLAVAVRDVALHALPRTWKLPDAIDGQLSGAAKLRLVLAEPTMRTEGGGEGTVNKLRFLGVPTPGTAKLRLFPSPGGFQFRNHIAKDANGSALKIFESNPWSLGGFLETFSSAVTIGSKQLLEGAAAGVGWLRRLDQPRPEGQEPTIFETDLALTDIDLEQVVRQLKIALPFDLAGRASIQCKVAFPIDSPSDLKSYRFRGDVQASALRVAGTELVNFRSRIVYGDGVIRLETVHGEIPRENDGQKAPPGSIEGSARFQVVPLGDLSATLRVEQLPAGTILGWFAAPPGLVSGTLSGSGQFHAPGERLRDLSTWAASGEFQADGLDVRGINLRDCKTTIALANGIATFPDLRGTWIGVPLTGAVTVRLLDGGHTEGKLTLRGAGLGRLVAAYYPGSVLDVLHGSVDANFGFQLERFDRPLTGRGTIALSNVRWNDALVSDRLLGEIVLAPDVLRLRNVTGQIGGGELRCHVALRFGQQLRLSSSLELYRVESARLVAPFPGLADFIDGPLDMTVRLGGSGELRGSGQAVLTRGHVVGVEVAEWRLPFDFSFVPGVSGECTVRESSAKIAQGRASVRSTFNWGTGLRMEGQIRFFDTELHGVLGRDSEVSSYATGRLTGHCDFNADNLRSSDDLNASINVTLGPSRAAEVPVLRQIIPFLGPAGSSRFESGELRGHLSRGVFRIQRFTLSGSVLQLIFEGTMTLAGRLNLDVTAGSAMLAPSPRAPRIPALSPLPVSLLAEATTFLANRIVRLRVTGTVRSPNIRAEPNLMLTEEAVRFFLSYSSLPIPGGR